MSARNAAILFRDIFVHLAEDGRCGVVNGRRVIDRDEFARWLWQQSQRFDFHPADMDCHEALEKLGLARRRTGGHHDDEEPWIYTEDE